MGVQHFNDGNYTLAKTEFELSVEVANWLGKTDSLALFNIGLACQGLTDYDGAIEAFKRCLAINYKKEYCYENLGYCYLFKDDIEGTESILKEGLTYYPKNNALLTSLLNLYLLTDEYDEALKLINILLQDYPTHAPYYSVKGSVLSSLDRSDEAISVLQKGLEFDQESFQIHFILGSLYYNKGADKIKEANNQDDFSLAEKLTNEATAEFVIAKKHFEKAHALQPDDRETMYGLKNVYAYTNDFDKLAEIKRKLSEN
jgi:tetratricopeptide (TPR) repeat protein